MRQPDKPEVWWMGVKGDIDKLFEGDHIRLTAEFRVTRRGIERIEDREVIHCQTVKAKLEKVQR